MDLLSETIGGVRVGRAEACRVTQSGTWALRYEPMNVSGFHLLLRGTAWLLTDTDEPRRLHPGDVVFAPSGAAHGLSHAPARLRHLPPAVLGPGSPNIDADVELVCGAYWLRSAPMPHILTKLPAVLVVSALEVDDPQLRMLFDLLESHLADTEPGAAVARSALLDLLLTHILRGWLRDNDDAALPVSDDPAIETVLRRIHADWAQVWTVQQLSVMANLSRKTFTRLFTEATGQAPGAYMSTWRLAAGARLLQETDAPLVAIAGRVGYATEFSFSAAFRRQYGMAPGRFRLLDRSRVIGGSDGLGVTLAK